NGIEIGQNRLFDWLRTNGYLISKKGSSYNLPTQKSMNLGLFKIKETTINHSNGSVSISKTAKVTGKGQQYFINKFLNCAKVTFFGSDKKLVTYVDAQKHPKQKKS
ncbi:MAG: phage antirepressor KilAC domain-containing protein, partial [Lactobacillus gasseri]|nr:phage antirepressor KilAC domain-containing protein [Lactobacillus gasseri]